MARIDDELLDEGGGYDPIRSHPWYGQIRSWYHDYLNAEPSDEEVASHFGNPGGLDAILAMLRQEGKQRGTYDTENPSTGGGGGGGGGEGGGGKGRLPDESGGRYDLWRAKAKDWLTTLGRKYGVPIDAGDIEDLARWGDQMPAQYGAWEAKYAARGKGGPNTPGPRTPGPRTIPGLGDLLQPYPYEFETPDLSAEWQRAVANLPPIPKLNVPSVPGLPTFDYPDYVSRPLPEPERFVPEPFTMPTAADMLADPGYEARETRGRKALEAGQAAKGILRTGGSLKDLLEYGQNFASQEFGNVFDRRFNTWSANEGNRFAASQANWQNTLGAEANRREDFLTGRDTALTKHRTNVDTTLGGWDRELQRLKAEYEPQALEWTTKAGVGERAANRALDFGYKKFQDDYERWWQNKNDIFTRLKWQSEFDRDSANLT